MNTRGSIFLASKASRLRWAVLAIIVASAFSVDYFLKRDISGKVSEAWVSACDESRTTVACLERIATHHPRCFGLAYESMMFTFGRNRWESFRLLDYEACMNRDQLVTPLEIGI
ncbi:MAG: hypothetical protein ACU85U_07505 [Gammaproteobacteria bacterium]|jgi:hypothetical protein